MRRPRAVQPTPTWDEVRSQAHADGIVHIGVASAEILHRARAELFRRRDAGLAADMRFTFNNPERSTDPRRAVAGARSIIVAAAPYLATTEPEPTASPAGRVARYAWVDYYEPLRQRLRVIARRIRASGERAVVFADDNSIVDREVAYRAGLGWFGKNTNLLVSGAGSFFVLGSIITTAEYPPAEPVGDGCGTCVRCLDGCPTGAIVAPGVLDANRCLAWLLQRAGTFPPQYREALGDRFYGCDDCQDVCPPAVRLGPREAVALPDVDPWGDRQPPQAYVDVLDVLECDDDDLLARYGRWYLADRDPRWWRRNALVIVGNTAQVDDRRARHLLDRYRHGDDPILAEHAAWAVARLDRRAFDEAGVAASDTMGAP